MSAVPSPTGGGTSGGGPNGGVTLLPGFTLKPVVGKDFVNKDLADGQIVVAVKQMDKKFVNMLGQHNHTSLLVNYIGGVKDEEEEVEREKKLMEDAESDAFLDNAKWDEHLAKLKEELDRDVDHLHVDTEGESVYKQNGMSKGKCLDQSWVGRSRIPRTVKYG